MAGTALVKAEQTGLESQARAFMERAKMALNKVHRFYGLKTGKYGLAGTLSDYHGPSLSLSRHISSDGHAHVLINAFTNFSLPGYRPVHVRVVVCEDEHKNALKSFYNDKDKAFVRRSEINLLTLDEDGCSAFAEAYSSCVAFWASKDKIKVRRNKSKFEAMAALVTALMLDPALTPEAFFAGHRPSDKKAGYVSLDIDVPDLAQEKAAYEEALAVLDDPRGIDLASFGDQVSMRAAKAASAIDDWHIQNNHSVPASFRLMKGLSDMVDEFRQADGVESLTPETLATRYNEVARQIKALRASLPKDMNDTKRFLEDSGDASKALQLYSVMTDWYKDGFQSKINNLQTMTVHADSVAPRFTGDFLSVKMASLRKSAIVRVQKATEMDHVTAPTFQAVYMTLSEMQLEIEQIDRVLSKAVRSEILRQMERQSRAADFNFAAYGLRISSAEREQFDNLRPEQQDEIVDRDYGALARLASKWNQTIGDAERAVSQIESGTAQPLMLTYQASDKDRPDEGTIRLVPQ